MPKKANLSKTNWIQTVSGKKLNILKPNLKDIDIEDIATSLSNTCRFTGHIKDGCHASVAAHSILVCLLAKENGEDSLTQFAALLHDAPEFALGDVNSPLKNLLPDYKRIEERWTKAIGLKYNVPLNAFKDIKPYDHEALLIEAQSVFNVRRPEWESENLHPYSIPYRKFYGVEWRPDFAKELFLIMFRSFTVKFK